LLRLAGTEELSLLCQNAFGVGGLQVGRVGRRREELEALAVA